MYFDGSLNLQSASAGVLFISPQGDYLKYVLQIHYKASNNGAEYEALIIGLEILHDLGAKEVLIIGDSQLVIKQLVGEYRCTSMSLAHYFTAAIQLIDSF